MQFFDAGRDFLEQHRLAGLGRRHDQAALPLADGRYQIHDAHRQIRLPVLQREPLVREHRCQGIKIRPPSGRTGLVPVDGGHVQQRAEFLVLRRVPGDAEDLVAGLQVKAADLRLGDVDVLVAGQVVVESQEPIAAVRDLEDAFDLFAFLPLLLAGAVFVAAVALLQRVRGGRFRLFRYRLRGCLRGRYRSRLFRRFRGLGRNPRVREGQQPVDQLVFLAFIVCGNTGRFGQFS